MNGIVSAATDIWADNRRRAVALILVALTGAIVFAFWEALVGFNKRWSTEDELSHSFFLPLISAWILWERKDALKSSLGAPVFPLGFAAATLAMFMTLAGAATHVALAEQIGLVLLALSIPLVLGGWSAWKLSVIPLLYLFFMVPPPKMFITILSQNFQLMSSELGVTMIRWFGIPVYSTGVIIELPDDVRLEVAAACSGLNYLFPFLSLGALAAYFYNGPLWQRAIILLITIPITIFMNSFRIAMTAVLTVKFGGKHTEGFVHAFEGWVVFVLCIIFLLGAIWIMTLLRGQKSPLAFVGFDDVEAIPPKAPWSHDAFVKAGVALTLLVLTFGVANHLVAKRELIIPERLTFDTLPLEYPDWKSRNAPLSADVVRVMGADDFILSDMIGPDGEYINMYIAYLEARRDGKAWHSPLQCLPGGGWEVVVREEMDAETAAGKPFKLNRMVIRQKENELLVHYWYDQRGRKIANEFTMRAMVVWDDLTRRRSDGAMVRLMTPILAGETEEDAAARLTEMRLDLEPKLIKYVPH